jgi:hypothetical protein
MIPHLDSPEVNEARSRLALRRRRARRRLALTTLTALGVGIALLYALVEVRGPGAVADALLAPFRAVLQWSHGAPVPSRTLEARAPGVTAPRHAATSSASGALPAEGQVLGSLAKGSSGSGGAGSGAGAASGAGSTTGTSSTGPAVVSGAPRKAVGGTVGGVGTALDNTVGTVTTTVGGLGAAAGGPVGGVTGALTGTGGLVGGLTGGHH